MRWIMTVVILIFAFLAFRFYWSYEDWNEKKIQSELDQIAKAGHPSDRFLDHNLICFTQYGYGPWMREAISREAKKAGGNIEKSLSACGIKNSCCQLTSEAAGVIGFVRSEQIECVAVTRFMFVVEGERTVCIEPSHLKVSREVFKSVYDPHVNPRIGRIGEPYYKIEEQGP